MTSTAVCLRGMEDKKNNNRLLGVTISQGKERRFMDIESILSYRVITSETWAIREEDEATPFVANIIKRQATATATATATAVYYASNTPESGR